MTTQSAADWDPRSPEVLADQITAYDRMRHQCPVAYSDYLQWSLFRHADVVRVLADHVTFGNAMSAHLSVPNGMDPPVHTSFRRVIEPFFEPERMLAFEPVCRRIAAELAEAVRGAGEIELMGSFAQEFALRIQCAFMGWPSHLHEPLRQWVLKNQAATLGGHRAATAAVAREFDAEIRRLLDLRRETGSSAPNDVTTELLHATVDGRFLTDEEIVSIVRNWTVGELGTIAASVGIVAHFLATRPELQNRLRSEPSLLPPAIDEILRIHAPLIANRRVTTSAVTIGDREIEAGQRLTLIWASANRDEEVFGDPDEFRLDRDPSQNLLYGAGIHVCPGAPLARLELRIALEELLARTLRMIIVPDKPPARAAYPASGFSSLPLTIQ
jgi:cytochrome P450